MLLPPRKRQADFHEGLVFISAIVWLGISPKAVPIMSHERDV